MSIKAPTLDDLIDYIRDNEIVNAAITEAVHRFYYDHCFSPYTERPYNTPDVKAISKIHDILSAKNAGWRFTIKKRFERYHGWEPTNALHICNNPYKQSK